MTSVTFTNSVTYEVHSCPTCYMEYAAPVSYFTRKNETNGSWYCPEGHSVMFTKSDLVKAKEKLEQTRDELARSRRWLAEESERRKAEARSHAATKGHLTRMRNRIAVGMCPYCRRSIKQLREHVGSQHPDKATEFAKLAAEARAQSHD